MLYWFCFICNRGDHKFNTAGESSAVNAVDLKILRVIMEEIKF